MQSEVVLEVSVLRSWSKGKRKWTQTLGGILSKWDLKDNLHSDTSSKETTPTPTKPYYLRVPQPLVIIFFRSTTIIMPGITMKFRILNKINVFIIVFPMGGFVVQSTACSSREPGVSCQHIQQLTIAFTSSLRGSDTLFWIPQAGSIHIMYRHTSSQMFFLKRFSHRIAEF